MDYNYYLIRECEKLLEYRIKKLIVRKFDNNAKILSNIQYLVNYR